MGFLCLCKSSFHQMSQPVWYVKFEALAKMKCSEILWGDQLRHCGIELYGNYEYLFVIGIGMVYRWYRHWSFTQQGHADCLRGFHSIKY